MLLCKSTAVQYEVHVSLTEYIPGCFAQLQVPVSARPATPEKPPQECFAALTEACQVGNVVG